MKRDLAALASGAFDLLVIGGGVVGACIARDAARRGIKTALIEQNDFAAAARIALYYYDKTYQHGLDTNTSSYVKRLYFDHGNPFDIAQALQKFELPLTTRN